jgi:hypothetical protein
MGGCLSKHASLTAAKRQTSVACLARADAQNFARAVEPLCCICRQAEGAQWFFNVFTEYTNRTRYGRGEASSCYGPNRVAGSSKLCPRLLLCSHYLNVQPPGVVSHRIDVIDLTFQGFERALAVPAKGVSEHGADVWAVVLVMR